MKIFMIDVYGDETLIYKSFVEEGKFQAFRKINGDFDSQVEKIILLALKERPSKIMIDTTGIGRGLLDCLRKNIESYGLELKEDATVVY
jgi:hypothetical protein